MMENAEVSLSYTYLLSSAVLIPSPLLLKMPPELFVTENLDFCPLSTGRGQL